MDAIKKSVNALTITEKGLLVDEIKIDLKDLVSKSILIGGKLYLLKSNCDRDEYNSYVEHEFYLSRSTAIQMVQAYEKFGTEPEKIAGMPLRLVFALASENTSEKIVDWATKEHIGGNTPKIKDVQDKKSIERQKSEPKHSESVGEPIPETAAKCEQIMDDIENQNENETGESEKNEVPTIYLDIPSILSSISSINNVVSSIDKENLSVDDKNELKKVFNRLTGIAREIRMLYDDKREGKTRVVNSRLSDEQATELVDKLFESVEMNCPVAARKLPAKTNPGYDESVKAMKLLANDYDHDYDAVKAVIEWVTGDVNPGAPPGTFPGWGVVTQSVRGFREKYGKIVTAMEIADKAPVRESIVTPDGKKWGNHNGRTIKPE